MLAEKSGFYAVQVSDVPPLDGGAVPGIANTARMRQQASESKKVLRFLGKDVTGPWVYHQWAATGSVTKLHKHDSDRIEYLLSAKISFKLRGEKEPMILGPGSLTFVPAGQWYSYDVLEEGDILTIFLGAPGHSAS
jgi:hypothetical protein